METVEQTIELRNGVLLQKKHIDEDMCSYDAWFIVFPDKTKDIELDISDVLATRFAMWMNRDMMSDEDLIKWVSE